MTASRASFFNFGTTAGCPALDTPRSGYTKVSACSSGSIYTHLVINASNSVNIQGVEEGKGVRWAQHQALTVILIGEKDQLRLMEMM